MEPRRISASPRPCSGRRVVAARKRPRQEAVVSSVRKLQRREISSRRDRSFALSDAQERFRNIKLQEEFDTHDPKENTLLLPYLRKRHFTPTIQGTFKRGQPDAGFPIFESESLKWPGFVEFDDVNGKVLTYSAQDSTYKVFDLKNYTLLYSVSDKNVQEIKISPGIMLLIYTRTSSSVPLKILSIEDGTVLKSFSHLLHRNKKVDFIEQFNEKLLVKQEGENLQILDVRNFQLTEVSRTEFMTPSAFIFLWLYKHQQHTDWQMLGKNKSWKFVQAKESMEVPEHSLEALEDITALYYDEDRDEIYTGNRHGLVHLVPHVAGGMKKTLSHRPPEMRNPILNVLGLVRVLTVTREDAAPLMSTRGATGLRFVCNTGTGAFANGTPAFQTTPLGPAPAQSVLHNLTALTANPAWRGAGAERPRRNHLGESAITDGRTFGVRNFNSHH
ncbi:unnamed protein product [Miscanthus lutarioriparius]|uniref:Uncharacterized protein n=1 Tax=Miscanthus lutarioriparius TaxID=422564 RepID=A0A811RX78_9POAL|nr:unnamed protein product [Miscanthus lutarioriparius]